MSAIDPPSPLSAWRGNPFFVLELKADASRAEIERAGQRLLALLGIDSSGISAYATPLGVATRDADMVRQALAALRDPVQRANYELWANITPRETIAAAPSAPSDRLAIWENAEHGLGWAKL